MPKRKRFKRYMSHNAGTGLDTGHREMDISDVDMAKNWCQTFGHKRLVTPEDRYTEWRCLDCGATGTVLPDGTLQERASEEHRI